MDVHIFAIDDMVASNTDFQEQTSLFPDANEKLNQHIHPDKNFALENEGCACISADFQDMVTFQIIQDPFTNFL